MTGRIGRIDRRLFARVAAARLPGAEQVLPPLSSAANHGRLWFGAAGCSRPSAAPRPGVRRTAAWAPWRWRR
ncbi:hypothetical protein [Streptomyces sp. 135]|uniref:hypothetical protein n=1 Tax=Streptomyces sp. 135 TaxID=2838850 RepID=UPI003207F39A